MKELIEIAKKKVMSTYGGDLNRPWKVIFFDSYMDKKYRLEIHIWEGSPIKGHVVANYALKTIRAFNMEGNSIGRWEEDGFKFRD